MRIPSVSRRPSRNFHDVPLPAQWTILIAASIVLGGALEIVHLPAALLLGPMIAAIVLASRDSRIAIPAVPFVLAQGVVGALIARSVPATIVGQIAKNGSIFCAGVVLVIVAAALLGYVLARRRVLPGSTAVWGSSPGAATAMVLMAEANGADVRLVAFMQYLRVVCVAVVATLVAHVWVHAGSAVPPAIDWFPPIRVVPFAETILLIVVSVLAAPRLKIPAGAFLIPAFLGAFLNDVGLIHVFLPPWLLALSYALVGWSIGLRFNASILAYVAKAFPRVVLSIFALIGTCGLIAFGLVRLAGIDPLTAYLATSPGGADSVAIIAASSKVDVPFIMAMQIARVLVVIAVGPSLSKFVARHVPASDASDDRRAA